MSAWPPNRQRMGRIMTFEEALAVSLTEVGRREISPLYLADAREAGVKGNACDEAMRAGLRAVTVGERTYVRFGSEWYSLNFEAYHA